MNKIIFSCITTFITIFAHNAYCASFDCSKAKSPIEKSICAIPKASKLDEELNVLYKQVMTKLDPEAQKVMYYEQMQWLQKLIEKKIPREIIDTYKQRIAEIKQIMPIAMGKNDKKISINNKEEKKEHEEIPGKIDNNKAGKLLPEITVISRNSYNIYSKKIKNKPIAYDQIDVKDEFSAKINKLVENIIIDSVKNVMVLDGLTITIKQISDNIFRVESLCNYSGGAYPDYIRECYYLNKQTGKLLMANDLFNFTNVNYIISAMHAYVNPECYEANYDYRKDFWPEIINAASITAALKDVRNVSLDAKTLNIDLNLIHAIRIAGIFVVSNDKIKPFMSEFLRSELKLS